MRSALLLLLLAVAACSARPEGVRPVAAGESRADGIVTMASSGTIWNPVDPDWRMAQAAADKRCRAWGYEGAESYAGWQDACRAYDLSRPLRAQQVTRFYPCARIAAPGRPRAAY